MWLEIFEGPPPSAEILADLKQVGLAKRASGHDKVCDNCAGLSAAVPPYVRRCTLSSVEDKELFVDWADFAAVPGREFLVFVQGALDNLCQQRC